MVGEGGGLCDFSVIPSPNWTFRFWTALVLGLGLGLGAWTSDSGLTNALQEVTNSQSTCKALAVSLSIKVSSLLFAFAPNYIKSLIDFIRQCQGH